MKKYKLSILVPHADETADKCRALFDSVDAQAGISLSDVECVVCDDGPGRPNVDDALCGRHFLIRHVGTKERKGVSAVRNRLLDEARGEWILYCDADDCFSGGRGLETAFKRMSAEGPDAPNMVTFRYLREKQDGGTLPYYNESHVHAKFFRREFVAASGVRWPEHITHNEDSAFAPVLADKAGKTLLKAEADAPFYVWRYNPDSVTRRESAQTYSIKYFPEFVDAVRYASGYYADDKRKRDLKALSTAYYSYGFLNAPCFRHGPDEYRRYYEESCRAVSELCAGADRGLIETEDFMESKANCDENLKASFGIDVGSHGLKFGEWLDEIGVPAGKEGGAE